MVPTEIRSHNCTISHHYCCGNCEYYTIITHHLQSNLQLNLSHFYHQDSKLNLLLHRHRKMFLNGRGWGVANSNNNYHVYRPHQNLRRGHQPLEGNTPPYTHTPPPPCHSNATVLVRDCDF